MIYLDSFEFDNPENEYTPTLKLLIVDPANCVVWNELFFPNDKDTTEIIYSTRNDTKQYFPAYILEGCTTSFNGTHYEVRHNPVDFKGQV